MFQLLPLPLYQPNVWLPLKSNTPRLCGDNKSSKTDYWKLCQHLSQHDGDNAESVNVYRKKNGSKCFDLWDDHFICRLWQS